MIEELYELLHPAEAVENFTINHLPEDLKIKSNRALNNYKAGLCISHEQMKQKMQEWLMKYGICCKSFLLFIGTKAAKGKLFNG